MTRTYVLTMLFPAAAAAAACGCGVARRLSAPASLRELALRAGRVSARARARARARVLSLRAAARTHRRAPTTAHPCARERRAWPVCEVGRGERARGEPARGEVRVVWRRCVSVVCVPVGSRGRRKGEGQVPRVRSPRVCVHAGPEARGCVLGRVGVQELGRVGCVRERGHNA